MADVESFESRILAFEQAWDDGTPLDIADVLQNCGDESERIPLLIELVCVDLEYRWRSSGSAKWTVADYVDQIEDLRSLAELPLEMIEEEYRVRHRWGDCPTHEAYVARFNDRQADIRQRLAQIDKELREEAGNGSSTPSMRNSGAPTARRSVTIPDPLAWLPFTDYLLQEMIGAGRTGKVYRAWQRSLGRPVAVKFLRKSFQQNHVAVARFVEEAGTLSQLADPGIVQFFGMGTTPGGGYFTAMELVEGFDLSYSCRSGKTAVADCVRWMIQACRAIAHAHQRGFIHCDLKPANLLLDRSGNVRVTDFGLARSLSDASQPSDRIEGTAAFIAPEQVSDWWGPISLRTDIYGIGAVLFTLLTGEPPYRGATVAEILADVVSGTTVKAPIELRPDLPTDVNNICVRCLAKSPSARYDKIEDVGAALRRAARDC